MIRLGKHLDLPLDAVTQKIALLGMSGSGKTNAMTVLVEQMLDRKAQVVICDPKGEAWGLRLMKDGKTSGYSIPVFGGERGDVPLHPDMGARIAELIVKNEYSAVLDLSEFTSNELARFGYDFATTLLHWKKQRPGAMCLLLDEAQDFIPQNPQPASRESNYEPRMLHAFERLQKQGRAKGIGMVIAGQRPQELNKKVLNLCEMWAIFRMAGLQERATVRKIIGERDPEVAREIDGLMPRLETGAAYVWSAFWLKKSEVFELSERRTFDSSRTPEVGARQVEARKLSPLDIKSLNEAMSDVVEKAKANDPDALRIEIRELKRQLAAAPKSERVEVPVVIEGQLKALADTLEQVKAAVEEVRRVQVRAGELSEHLDSIARQIGATVATAMVKTARDKARTVEPLPLDQSRVENAFRDVRQFRERSKPESANGFTPNGTQQRILDALAWFETVGNSHPTNIQVGAIALLDSTGGHFSNVVGPLSSNGLIERGNGEMWLTAKGRAASSVPEHISSLADYHTVLKARVRRARSASGKTVAMLEVIISRGGRELSNEEVGRAVGIDHTGGHFSNTIGPLSTIGLIERRGGIVRPTDVLFPPGLR